MNPGTRDLRCGCSKQHLNLCTKLPTSLLLYTTYYLMEYQIIIIRPKGLTQFTNIKHLHCARYCCKRFIYVILLFKSSPHYMLNQVLLKLFSFTHKDRGVEKLTKLAVTVQVAKPGPIPCTLLLGLYGSRVQSDHYCLS